MIIKILQKMNDLNKFGEVILMVMDFLIVVGIFCILAIGVFQIFKVLLSKGDRNDND